MARLRTLKPGFFLDDELAECQPLARLLFAGLWTIADRDGRLRDRPRKIKAETLPYDDCDVNELLRDLATHGSPTRFIVRYSVEECPYIAIPSWDKHQSPHVKEVPSTIPAPDKHDASTDLAPYEPPSSCLGSCLGSGNLDTGKDSLSDSDESTAPVPSRVESPKLSTLSPDDWQSRADSLLAGSNFPDDLTSLADIMAAENKTGKVSLPRVIRELYEPLVELQAHVSDDALRYGLRAAITAGAPNHHYVKKAALGYRPLAGVAGNSAAADLTDYDRDFLTD